MKPESKIEERDDCSDKRMVRYPRLECRRDSPATGQVWVVDDQSRVWASFAMRHHETGAMMASRNRDEAERFIINLRTEWMCRDIDEESNRKLDKITGDSHPPEPI